MLIGSIVKTKCATLEVVPNITIDVPTRLSLSIKTTEEDFRRVVLPIEGWEVFVISPLEDATKISVEMTPTQPAPPRDLATEIDEIKVKIEKLLKE